MFTRAIEVGYMTCLQDVRRGSYDLAPSQCAVSGGEAAADNDRTSATAAPVTACEPAAFEITVLDWPRRPG